MELYLYVWFTLITIQNSQKDYVQPWMIKLWAYWGRASFWFHGVWILILQKNAQTTDHMSKSLNPKAFAFLCVMGQYDGKKCLLCKVHIFWEGHKSLWNLHLTFDCVYCGQKLGEDFAKCLWPSQNIWTTSLLYNR